MTQGELRLQKWRKLMVFLGTYHRCPSKSIPEERNMRSWWKHNKKLLNVEEMKEGRVALFKKLEMGKSIERLIREPDSIVDVLN